MKDELEIKCDTILESLPNSQTKYIISGMFAEFFCEIDRLNRVIVHAHDALLKGQNDKEILDILCRGWSE